MSQSSVAQRSASTARTTAKAAPPMAGQTAAVALLNPLVGEIAGVLLDLGGAAHRDVVAAYVAQRRGWYRPPESLKRELAAAFDAYCGEADDPRAPGLLHLPFGPHSARWALTDRGYRMLRMERAR
ncbi:hypothetical protein [Caulobacter sp. 1776]|uniref:hypothetical protein n=1 Tax=Caulobacter sp. 1776 TaxID=3156420 RepID=UPI00339750B2